MEQVITNSLSMDGMRFVKLISDAPVSRERMMGFVAESAVEMAKIRCYDTSALSIFYGEATWPVREAVDFHCEGWPKFRRLVAWNLEKCASVTAALHDAAGEFERLFGGRARFAFIKNLPKRSSVTHVTEVRDSGSTPLPLNGVEVGDLNLFQSEWMIERCVAIGCLRK
jgi:hypothetical protein